MLSLDCVRRSLQTHFRIVLEFSRRTSRPAPGACAVWSRIACVHDCRHIFKVCSSCQEAWADQTRPDQAKRSSLSLSHTDINPSKSAHFRFNEQNSHRCVDLFISRGSSRQRWRSISPPHAAQLLKERWIQMCWKGWLIWWVFALLFTREKGRRVSVSSDIMKLQPQKALGAGAWACWINVFGAYLSSHDAAESVRKRSAQLCFCG